MARKSGGKGRGQKPRGSARAGRPGVSRRTIQRDEDSTQLLERGEGPTTEELIDPEVDSPSEITTEGGPAADAAYRLGGPRHDLREPTNPRSGGTGGEGGYSTLGGGVYPDEGSSEDSPHHGDWQRHSTGASSGARGQEGFGFPGEQTWGEEQFAAERQEAGTRSQPRRGRQSQRRSDDALGREIHEILTKDPELDATEIEVEVEGGAVRLTGIVESSDAKLLAEELVESLPGVREVHNGLRVAH